MLNIRNLGNACFPFVENLDTLPVTEGTPKDFIFFYIIDFLEEEYDPALPDANHYDFDVYLFFLRRARATLEARHVAIMKLTLLTLYRAGDNITELLPELRTDCLEQERLVEMFGDNGVPLHPTGTFIDDNCREDYIRSVR